MSVGDRIKNIRATRGLSQVALAKAAEVSPQAVSQWENGKTEPEFARLNMVANVLGVDVLWLANGDGPQMLEQRTYTGRAVPVVPLTDAINFGPYLVRSEPYPLGKDCVVPTKKIIGQGFALRISKETTQGNYGVGDIVVFDTAEEAVTGDMVVAVSFSAPFDPLFRKLEYVENSGGEGCIRLLSLDPDMSTIVLGGRERPGLIVGVMVEHRKFR